MPDNYQNQDGNDYNPQNLDQPPQIMDYPEIKPIEYPQPEQAWYNQPEPLPQFENPPPDFQYDNSTQNYEPYQPLVDYAEKPKKQKKVKHKKRKRLTFTSIILILISLAIVFFAIQYFVNESYLNKHLSDEPFTYSNTDYREYVTSNIVLPDSFDDSYEVIWESSHPEILSPDGVVNRPIDKNQTVTLTLKLKKGFWYSQRKYEFVVIKSGTISSKKVFELTNDMINNGISTNEFIITYHESGDIYSINGNFNNTLIESELDAAVVIEVYRDLLNIPDKMSFKLKDIQNSLIGKSYYFSPIIEDVEIGGQRVVISTNNDYLSAITTTVKNVELTNETLTEEELSEIAQKHLGWTNAKISIIEKSFYNGAIAYKFTAFDELDGNGIAVLIVNAATKEVIPENVMFNTSWESLKGSGKDEMGVTQTFNVFKGDGLIGDTYYLKDPIRNISIIDGSFLNFVDMYYNNKYNIVSNAKNKWDKYPQGISCLTNLATVYDWYKDNLGFVSIDGKNQPLYCFINAEKIQKEIIDNAAYIGGDIQVFFNGSAKTNLKYSMLSKLDITAHEYTHGIFQHVANKGFGNGVMLQSINEGYADIFGCLVEGNWTLGEGIMTKYEAIRDPSGTLTNLHGYAPKKYFGTGWSYSDGHDNGLLLSQTAYIMIQKGFSENDVARIWFQSLYYGYDDSSDFLTVRSHVEQAARDLGYSEEQIVIIGDIFASFDIGELATKKIESFAVEGDRLKDNTTERTYILVVSPIGTVVANTPIWIFEEDTNVGTTATDAQMSEFLSSYVSHHLNESTEDKTWNVSVEYSKYSPRAMDVMGYFLDDAKQGLLGQMTNDTGLTNEDANVLLSMAFFAFKFEGTAYEFFSEILELDYSKLIIEEDGTISYDMTE